ncbi:hypothetical protein [Citrobacter sp. CK186]|uniref:hypothetical protein n=1 Tax=Citrobacter sp. CK186 TaxID=2985095 RepID=UPI002576686E|nr:hypothetical protein [Citrobacter sp. CK186]MDM3032112.1 hypothetical protein [Citrobacter sp. CK186]
MSDYFFIGLIGLLFVLALFCMVMMWRVTLVYEWRTKALLASIDDYLALPSYDEMMWMVWIWKLERFPRRDNLGTKVNK